ncbi:MAG: 6-carboxytetrahydropterin synthase [Bdellovibrionales bacterium]
MNRTRLARRRGFQCLHRYQVEDWPAEKNREIFGACFTPGGHGHNYSLEVYLEGVPDPVTGMILNLADLDRVLADVLSAVEGKRLHDEVPQLQGRVPTTENLAEFLFAQLQSRCGRLAEGVRLVKIRLYEYEDLWVDVWA